MEYFDKLLVGVDEGLKEEFLRVKKLQEENFNDQKDAFAEIFWQVYAKIAEILEESSPLEQKFFIRAGLADPRYISKEEFERIKDVFKSEDSDTIYYADEWIVAVKSGKIPSSTFEDVIQDTPQQKSIDLSWIQKEYERKLFERSIEEEKLRDLVKGVQGKGPYSKGVYVIFDEIMKTMGNLRRMDNDIKTLKETIERIDSQQKINSSKSSNPSKIGTLFTEHLVIRQMVKKAIGKFGISYPVLLSSYLRSVNRIFSKQFTKSMFENFKKIDPKILMRSIKGAEIFMPPYIILIPGYGELGFCWEPVEGLNIYGRGRIVVPIFSRKDVIPFFQAFGEYHWKLEKELAYGRWMEEGLTGEYYQYLEANKMKGNPLEFFLKDYVLWTTKEVNGIQKLEKPIREIFWRYIPFDDSIKEELSKLSYIYQQLWEKDLRKKQKEKY